jgi:hypothetical protein
MSDAPPVLLRQMDRTFIPYEDFRKVVEHVQLANYDVNRPIRVGDSALCTVFSGTNLIKAHVNTLDHEHARDIVGYVLRVQARLNTDNVEYTVRLTPDVTHVFIREDLPAVEDIMMNPDGPKTCLTLDNGNLTYRGAGQDPSHFVGVSLRVLRDREGGHRYPFVAVTVTNVDVVSKVFDSIMNIEHGRQVPVFAHRRVRPRLAPPAQILAQPAQPAQPALVVYAPAQPAQLALVVYAPAQLEMVVYAPAQLEMVVYAPV